MAENPVGESILTLAGLTAYQNASATGASIQPLTYQLSSKDYDLAAEGPTLDALDDVWRTDEISGYFTVDDDTVEYLLDIPAEDAEAYAYTAGLFLADGTLFMLAKPPYPFPPLFHQRFKIQLKYADAVALTDFKYLNFSETTQDLVTLGAKATANLQVLRNAHELGLQKQFMFRR